MASVFVYFGIIAMFLIIPFRWRPREQSTETSSTAPIARQPKTFVDENGYLRFIDSNRLVHRWAAEKKLGRRLYPWEIVHHIDGFKRNNRPENLLVCSMEEHDQLHRDNLKYTGDWYGKPEPRRLG